MLFILAAVGLGLFSWASDLVGPQWVGNLAAPWVLVAFFSGRASTARSRLLVPAAVLVGGAVTYYVLRVLIDQSISRGFLSNVGLFWMIGAAAIGCVVGGLGAASRHHPALVSLLPGVLLGEAVAVLVLSQRMLQVGVEVVLACGWLAVIRVRSLGVTLVGASATLSAAIAYRVVLRII